MHYFMPCVLPALNCPRVMSADAGPRTRTHGSHYLTNQKNSWPPAGPYPLLHPAPLPACPPVRLAGLLCISHRSGGRGVGITAGLHIRPPFSPRLVSAPADSPRPFRRARCAERYGQHAAIWTHIPDIWAAAGACGSGRRKRGRRGGGKCGRMRRRGDQNRVAVKRRGSG